MRTSARDYLILIAVCVLLFAPPILYRELSGVELRTALFTRNILTCGPSFIPRLYDSPYFDYPPLYFLLSALFSKITGGINNFSLALPDILGAIGTLILVFLFADRLNRGSRIIAGLALLTTPLFFILATEPIVDMLLTFFITSTLISYFIYLSNRKTYLLLLSWAGFAGGALTKGPVGVIVPLSVILVYLAATRQWEELAGSFLKLGVGLALLACICALCVILSDGRTALKELIDAQLLDRITDEPNRSPAFYLVVFLVGFAPWSLFALPQLFLSAKQEGEKKSILIFCKIWLITVFFIFTLANIKKTRYLLPAAPPTAILCAWFWETCLSARKAPYIRKLLSSIRLLCIIFLAVGTALSLILPCWLPFSSAIFLWTLPLFGTLVLSVAFLHPLSNARGVFFLMAAVIIFGFTAFSQFGYPWTNAKEEARPFVSAVGNEAQGSPVVFFDIDRDHEGLRFTYWYGHEDTLSFTDTIEDFEFVLSYESPAIAVVPLHWKEWFRAAMDDRLEFLFDGRLGKFKASAFCSRAESH